MQISQQPRPKWSETPGTPVPTSRIHVSRAVFQLCGKKVLIKEAKHFRKVPLHVVKQIYEDGTGLPAPTLDRTKGERSLKMKIAEAIERSSRFALDTEDCLEQSRVEKAKRAVKARVLQTAQKRATAAKRSSAFRSRILQAATDAALPKFPDLDEEISPATSDGQPVPSLDNLQPQILAEYRSDEELSLPSDAAFPDAKVAGVDQSSIAKWRSLDADTLKRDLKKLSSQKPVTKTMCPTWQARSDILSNIAGADITLFCKREHLRNNEVFSQLLVQKFDFAPVHKLLTAFAEGKRETLVFPILGVPQGKWAELNGTAFDLEGGIQWRIDNDLPAWTERVVRLRVLLPLIKFLLEAKKRKLIVMDIKTKNCANMTSDRDDIVLLDIGLYPEESSHIYHTYTLKWVHFRQLLGCSVDASVGLYSAALLSLKMLTLELPFHLPDDADPNEVARKILELRSRLPELFLRLVRKHGLSESLAALLCTMLSEDSLDLEAIQTLVEDLGRPAKRCNHNVMILNRWKLAAERHENLEKREQQHDKLEIQVAQLSAELAEVKLHTPELPPGKEQFQRAYDTAQNRKDALSFKTAHEMAMAEATHTLLERNKNLQRKLDEFQAGGAHPTEGNHDEHGASTADSKKTSVDDQLAATREQLSHVEAELSSAQRLIGELKGEVQKKDEELETLRKQLRALVTL